MLEDINAQAYHLGVVVRANLSNETVDRDEGQHDVLDAVQILIVAGILRGSDNDQ
jgi:hypothetical protein